MILHATHPTDATLILPIDSLGVLVVHQGDWPQREALWKSLTDEGMRHPILALRLPWLEFLRYRRLHNKWRVGDEPKRYEPDDVVYAVKRGNQRVAYALERGYTHIAVDVYDTDHEIELAHARHDALDAEGE